MRAGGFDFGLLNIALRALWSVYTPNSVPKRNRRKCSIPQNKLNPSISVCEYLLSIGDRALLAYDIIRYSSVDLSRWARIAQMPRGDRQRSVGFF